MLSKGVWQMSWVVWISYELKKVEQESLYSSIAFSSSGLPWPNRSRMPILDFSLSRGVFSGLGG